MVESRKDKAERVEEASRFWSATKDSAVARADRVAERANPHSSTIAGKDGPLRRDNVVQLPVVLTTEAVIEGLIHTGDEEQKAFWTGVKERSGKIAELKVGDVISEFELHRMIRHPGLNEDPEIPDDLLED